ncbi:MAG TPA: hypothetical protein VM492_18555 [Sumerlaeia bacterium]|nr:hypothetical protein [Sumerlaeia bacterium]
MGILPMKPGRDARAAENAAWANPGNGGPPDQSRIALLRDRW